MPEASFPGDGQDGEQPPPAVPARDETPATPGGGPRDAEGPTGHAGTPEDGHPDDHGGALTGPDDDGLPGAPAAPDDDDWDGDAEMAAYFADLDAGRRRIPEEWEIESRPPVTISLGDAADVDPAELAAMLGPDGLGGEVFAQDRPAGVMRPNPVLAALTERAAGEAARLSDDELLGAVAAARRLAARAEYLELTAIAEFTRRQDARHEAAIAAKVPPGRRDGEFADSELGYELVTSGNAARDTMDMAQALQTRLPATRAALAAGLIDGSRARIIWRHTRVLTDADAAHADQVLAGAAPHLRYDQLARRAIALAMKLDPEAMKRGKDQARRDGQRVEARREDSGNACLAGRELPVEDVLASKAHIDAMAAALRNGGLPGTLRHLRALAYTDLTQGRNPLDRLTRPGDETANDARPDGAGATDSEAGAGGGLDEDPYADDDTDPGTGPDDGPGAPDRDPAPFPALINLTIPAGTILGLSDAPADIGGWGLADSTDTRRLARAAARHPATRWCATLIGPDGTAIAHGCARGPQPWIPPPAPGPGQRPAGGGTRDGPATRDPTTPTGSGLAGGGRDGPAARDGTTHPGPGPDPGQAAALTELLRRLNLTLHPIARGTCDHRHREDRYTPSRLLKHLVGARTATCPAPGCGAQAYHNDLDHTLAYPAGPTDECNFGPPCRHHHRVKQAPGWTLEQPEPGIFRWTTPSGRVYTTYPTVYET